MKKIQIQDTCGICDGCGVVQHHAWEEFNKLDDKHRAETGSFMTQEECEQWFYQAGYSTLPPEEPHCGECEGTGLTYRMVELSELAELISEYLGVGQPEKNKA